MGQMLTLGERDQTPHPKDEEIWRLKHELADVQNFMESIIQSIGSGIILTQMDDTITYINRAGEKILGYVKHDLLEKPFAILGLREKQSVVHSLLDHTDERDPAAPEHVFQHTRPRTRKTRRKRIQIALP